MTSTVTSPAAPATARSGIAAQSSRRPPGRRELRVVRVALVVIALAVLDDAFWHREPGTAVSDQLLSGLVPVVTA